VVFLSSIISCRTIPEAPGAPNALQQKARLFDHLVGKRQQR
jgi:hypothetical protein